MHLLSDSAIDLLRGKALEAIATYSQFHTAAIASLNNMLSRRNDLRDPMPASFALA